MSTSLAKRLTELETMNTVALQIEWRRLFRSEPPSLSRDLLKRAIGYRYQELEFGGLSKAAARKLRSAADAIAAKAQRAGSASDKPERRAASDRPTLLPGARLVREWHGRTHVVTVTETGFEFSGRSYRSLTEIAHDITGTHWSGPRFFGIGSSSGKTNGGRAKGKLASSSGATPGKAKARHHG